MFSQVVLNGFQMIARMASVEIPASRAEHRAFIGIYPPSVSKGFRQWRVQRFEIPKEPVNQYFGEDQMVDSQFIHLDTLEEVEQLIARWGIESAGFTAPWKNDWPL